jgi:glycosyltransferase involved in cell wall biosynthesis
MSERGPDSKIGRTGEPIRVLHVCDKFGINGATVHGITRLLSWWFPRWDRTLVDCKLIGLRGHDASSQFLIDRGTAVECLGKGRFEPSTVSELVRRIRADRVQVLHLHGYGASDFGRLAGLLTGVPAIVHEHFVDPAMPAYQSVADRLLARATRLGVAVSASVIDFMATQRHLPRERLRLVPNGAPISDFRPVDPATAAAARQRWSLPDDRPIIGAIGRLGEQKGLTYLIAALPLLAAQGLRPQLVLIGDGDERPALEAQAKALGIGDQLTFTGFAGDTRALQTLLDLQVFPSLWEGTPLTLFEAMAMARPIVSTGVDGLGEVLRHDVTALLVPVRDPQALADAIGRVLADPALSARLAAAAKQASARYDIQHGVDMLQAIYAEVLGRPVVEAKPAEPKPIEPEPLGIEPAKSVPAPAAVP